MVAPMHDAATGRSSVLARLLLTVLRHRGFNVYTLEGKDASREKLEAFLTKRANEGKPSLSLFVYLGHGLKGCLQGQDLGESPLLDEDNIGMLAGSTIVSIACYSASALGRVSIAKGVRAFVGFKNLLFLPELIEGTRGYQGDFLRSLLVVPLCIAKGYTVKRSVQEFKKISEEYMKKYKKEQPLFYDDASAWLNNNLKGITYHGDSHTTVEPRFVT